MIDEVSDADAHVAEAQLLHAIRRRAGGVVELELEGEVGLGPREVHVAANVGGQVELHVGLEVDVRLEHVVQTRRLDLRNGQTAVLAGSRARIDQVEREPTAEEATLAAIGLGNRLVGGRELQEPQLRLELGQLGGVGDRRLDRDIKLGGAVSRAGVEIETVGGVMSGYCATGKVIMAINPTSTITMEITMAVTGRLIKVSASMGRIQNYELIIKAFRNGCFFVCGKSYIIYYKSKLFFYRRDARQFLSSKIFQ